MLKAGWICAVCVLATSIAAAEKHHPFSDVAYWAERWDTAERDEWQRPLSVLRLLGLDRGETVADIGAGTGYFTRPLSFVVGDEGRVYAVDIEPAMLEHIRGRDDIQQKNVETLLAEPDDPKLPEHSLDLILIVNTWHHIKKRSGYLAKLDRALLPDGRLALIDFRKDEIPVGPPAAEKLSREQVIAEFEKAGWRLASESTLLPYQYFFTFYPPRDREALKVVEHPSEPEGH